MKIAYWDLEAHDLNASFAPLLCGSIYGLPEQKMITFRQDQMVKIGAAEDMTDDRALCIAIRDKLEEYHITCGWFSKGYDIPLLNSRLVKWGEEPMKSLLHLDGIWFFKGWRGLKPMSAKLKHVAEFLEVGKHKPDVHPDVWLKARQGDKTAMDEVVHRCEEDTDITRLCIEKALDMNLVRNIQRYP